ncbi:MAG: glycoside hydrolase family 3 protein [Steroidobacteraceae bacterium]
MKSPLRCLLAASLPAATLLWLPFSAVLGAASSNDPVAIRVQSLLQALSPAEKLQLLSGDGQGMTTAAIPRVNIPQLRMADGPSGVRLPPPSTAYPANVTLAASFDERLAEQYGVQLGRDARARGAHFLLGPGLNIYRAPMNGRNFEYFGEDPYLAGRMTVGYVHGVQSQGVAATLKHFALNNSEFARNTSDSQIDERTLHELYLPAFEMGVKEGGAAALMDSYNKINGTYATANAHLNIDIARNQWGFDGLIMSDWGATHDTLGAALGGLDLEMPSPARFAPRRVQPLLEQGKLTQAVIDDKVRHLLTVAVRMGWLDREQRDLGIPRVNPAGDQVARQIAEEGVVLLKNQGGVLPLDLARVRTVAVIGPVGESTPQGGGGSGNVPAFQVSSLAQSLSEALASSGVKVLSLRGVPTLHHMALKTRITRGPEDTSPSGWMREDYANDTLGGIASPAVAEARLIEPQAVFMQDDDGNFVADGLDFAALDDLPPQPTSSRRTGYYHADHDATYTLFTRNGGMHRVLVDDRVVLDSWQLPRAYLQQASVALTAGVHKIVVEQHSEGARSFSGNGVILGLVAEDTVVDPAAERMAAAADAVIVAAGFDPVLEGEGSDREFALPPGQAQLIERLLAKQRNLAVVLTSGGAVDVSGFVERVPALLQAWYPGQEGGAALAGVLLGKVNPSGRLPFSWERKLEDNPSYASYYFSDPARQGIAYRNGLFVGYRGYERLGIKPLFPFGFGLSYSSFRYANLRTERLGNDGTFAVSFDVINTGACAGAEVAQLYLADLQPTVPRPLKELKAFERVYLQPGERRRVTLQLNARSFTWYDDKKQRWRANRGSYSLQIGGSSVDAQLAGTITLPVALDLAP